MPWDSGIIEEAAIKVLAKVGVEKVLNGETPSSNEIAAILTVAAHAIARYSAKNQTDPRSVLSPLLKEIEQETNRYKKEVTV